ncbi:MAG: M1 family aminopeptidase [Chitinophagaceae bacterium]
MNTYHFFRNVFFIFLIAFGYSNSIFSQNELTCSEAKYKQQLKMKKKNRAGLYANTLMSRYDVHFYFLDLNIERNTTVISGATTIGATILATTDTFCFELNAGLTIDSIFSNNQSVPFARSASIVYTVLPNPTTPSSNLNIRIHYHGDASIVGTSALGDGFTNDNSPTWGNAVTWSLSEPYSAYEWFPCKQFLQDKADSAWVFVTTDNQNKVGSNGMLEGIDSMSNNKVRYRWKTHYMIDYYLISVAVAKYVDYTIYAHPIGTSDSIPIKNYVYDNPNTLPFFKAKIDSIPMFLEYYSELFGLYPFYQEKYGHCMAPLGGGMEHQTMTTIGNLGNFGVNAHELMHQWWGDHVTCKTWSDIFINEGFASYGEYLALEKFRGKQAAQNDMLAVHNDVLLDPTAMVYFTDTNNVSRIFDSRLTYNKGSAVLHTLRFVLGDSLFFAGLKNFQQQYSFSTAGILDLKNSLMAFTGISLDDYFNQWLFGKGYPIFSLEYFSDASQLYLKISHTTSTTATPLFKTPLELKCFYSGGDTTIKVNITQNTNNMVLPMNRAITNISIDPNNWLLNDVGAIVVNPNLVFSGTQEVMDESSVTIFPNPTQDVIEIYTPFADGAKLSLHDLQGRILIDMPIKQQERISLATIPNGMYHIVIQRGTLRIKRKLVVLK